MKVKKIAVTLLIVSAILCISGCSIDKLNFSKNTRVAAMHAGCVISIDKNNYIVFNENDLSLNFDLDSWSDVISVSASRVHIGGVRKDGTVLSESIPTYDINLEEWANIVMLEFTEFYAYGLKDDGTVLYKSVNNCNLNDISNEKVSEWRDIVYIDTSTFGIAGVKKDGQVLVASNIFPELEEKVKDLDNVKLVSVATGVGRARVVALRNDGSVIEVRSDSINKYELDTYEDIKGAVKICAGDLFTAGLMPNGVLKVKCGSDYDKQMAMQKEVGDYSDLKALDNCEDIEDINSYENILVALKKDGEVLVGGFYE